MASEQDPQQPVAASAPEADQSQKLYDDPVTGEKISKTELKRRTKQRERAQARAVQTTKAAAEKTQPEEELNPNVSIVYPESGQSGRRSPMARQ